MIDGVQSGDNRKQHLGGADVAGGLLAADVLFAGLQGHAQRRAAAAVHGDADDPPGCLPLEFLAGGEEGRVGSAVAHGYAEALRVADDDIGAQLSRRR